MTKLFIFCTLKSLNVFPSLPWNSSSRGEHTTETHSVKMWCSYWQGLVLFNLKEVFGEQCDTQTPIIILFVTRNWWQHSQIIIFISLHMLISHILAYLINSSVIRIFTCICSTRDTVLKSSRFYNTWSCEMWLQGVVYCNLWVVGPGREVSRDPCADLPLLSGTKHVALTFQEYNK